MPDEREVLERRKAPVWGSGALASPRVSEIRPAGTWHLFDATAPTRRRKSAEGP